MVSYQAVFMPGPIGVNEPTTLELIPSDVIPNPVTDIVTIQNIPVNYKGKRILSVYDSNGKLVISNEITLSNEYVLTTSGFGSGTYYYNITTDTKPIKAGSFVVAR